MSFFILYKSTCRANGKVYYGIHETQDLFFGTPMGSDAYCGSLPEIVADVRKYGRAAFVVEAIQSYDNLEKANRGAQPYIKAVQGFNTYHTNARALAQMGNSNSLGSVRTEEEKQKLSEINMGPKNPFYGKTHTDAVKTRIAAARTASKWINDGFQARQIPKSDPIPESWKLGKSIKKATPTVAETKPEKPE